MQIMKPFPLVFFAASISACSQHKQPDYIDTDGRDFVTFAARKCNSFSDVVNASMVGIDENEYKNISTIESPGKTILIAIKKNGVFPDIKMVIEVKRESSWLSSHPGYIEKYGDPQNHVTLQSWHGDKHKMARHILNNLKTCEPPPILRSTGDAVHAGGFDYDTGERR